jgi:hypothetical protein
MQSFATMNLAAMISLAAGVLNGLFVIGGFVYMRSLQGSTHAGESGMSWMILSVIVVPLLFLSGLIAAFFAKDHRTMLLILNLSILVPGLFVLLSAGVF